MSLGDYTALVGEAATWLHRADITTAQVGVFVQLFESDFNAQMRVRQMEQETSQISTAGYLQHPTNWLNWKQIRGTNGGVSYNLEPVTDESAVNLTAGESGPSRLYKVRGSKTYLYPNTGGTFPATYYEGVALTSGTNWLLSAFPGAYLYGTLLQATAFIVDDPRVSLWQNAYEQNLERIREASRRGEWSGQAMMPNHTVRVV
jgi:hypothetical protein